MQKKIDYNKDLIGKYFGFLEVIEKDTEKAPNGGSKWICLCRACGKKKSISRSSLISGEIKSCGCRRYTLKEKNDIDLTNEIFGNLKVVKKVSGRGISTIWKCKCLLCGTEKDIIQGNLSRMVSCGCTHRKNASENVKDYIGIVEGTNISAISSKKVNSRNTSGYRGVSFNKKLGKWYAYIGFKGKIIGLGYYSNLMDAVEARKAAEKEIFEGFLESYYNNKNENDSPG